MTPFEQLGLSVPLVQAPMAGVSTPALAAAVCNAGALGSIAVGAGTAEQAAIQIEQVRALTARPFNVNLFVHQTPQPDAGREQRWIDSLAPLFHEFGAEPPRSLRAIYTSFRDDPDMLALLLHARPALVSFHFGLPPAETIAALRAHGILLAATATSLAEARAIEAAGIDLIVAQGIEAGGHRGLFDPAADDDALGCLPLTRLLTRTCGCPVIAAGGIMDGAGIAAALNLGAVAAQLGTAFIACPESSADAAYRALLDSPAAQHTVMTRLISGRPARSLPNRFTALNQQFGNQILPYYPISYDVGKALNAAAKAKGEHGFGAQWAGQGAPLARSMPAARLVETLTAELRACQA